MKQELKDKKKGRFVICSHCGYGWKTKSTNQFVTCPNCQKKTQPHKKST